MGEDERHRRRGDGSRRLTWDITRMWCRCGISLICVEMWGDMSRAGTVPFSMPPAALILPPAAGARLCPATARDSGGID